jgi:DNA modification methylase
MSLRQGDAHDLSVLGLQRESVRCTITSPPYWDLIKHYAGEEAEPDALEIGHGQSKEAYLKDVRQVFSQIYELTREDGVMWLVVDTMRDRKSTPTGLAEIMPLPFELAEQARLAKWRFQDVVIWGKDKTLPYSGQGKLRNLTEYVLFFTRSVEFAHYPYRCAESHMYPNEPMRDETSGGATWIAGWPERYHPLGKRPSNIWKFKLGTQGMWKQAAARHACPFPQDLVAQCIAMTTDKGDIVLDPFAGIGTVVAQAIAMSRKGVGLELYPANVETFHEQVLPKFQADWEAGAELRKLEREDQKAEARLIMRLRLLKAGKEMHRAVRELAENGSAEQPTPVVSTVVALQTPELGEIVDIDEGVVGRTGRLLLVCESGDPEMLSEQVRTLLVGPTLKGLGIELEVEALTGPELYERVDVAQLQEFSLSRHGAFTTPVDERLFDALPPLLTDVVLDPSVRGDAETERDRARLRGEYELLCSELKAERELPVIARRIGVTQVQLHKLLIRHGLIEAPKSFSVPLPDQLMIES